MNYLGFFLKMRKKEPKHILQFFFKIFYTVSELEKANKHIKFSIANS